MFVELVELGKRVRTGHNALGSCQCDFDIVIDKNGNYLGMIECNKLLTSEYIPSTAKKGKARLLLDKADQTLGFDGSSDYKKNHDEYIRKLNEYKDLPILSPILLFYSKPNEIEKALNAFKVLPKSKQKGNMTFLVKPDDTRPLCDDSVQNAIKKKYDNHSIKKNDICSVCGKRDYPIVETPHGGVNLPGSDKSCSLVSYNNNAFESYNLKGNLNSGICTNCARNYIEALQYLVSNGHEVITETGDKKYSNRQKISDDTIALFWTKEPNENIDPFSDICQPTEERVRKLFSSIVTGDYHRANTEIENYFYCCTMSSAAARIAVRDWLAISVSQYQKNLKQWFEDIATVYGGVINYPSIDSILNNCIKKKKNPKQSDFKAKARIGNLLWHAALTNTSLPLMILQSVLDQIEHEKTTKSCKTFSTEKSTVIRLVLNRNNKNTYYMKKELDEKNESKAYLCGRLFALICKLQFKAQGEVNSSIRDRFFASASITPCRVMGILLTRYVPVYQKKTKGAYSTSITEIAARIGHFPEKFNLTERGEFALGYYYQYNAKPNENINVN